MRTRLLILSIFLCAQRLHAAYVSKSLCGLRQCDHLKNLKLIPIRWKPAGAANACEIPNMVPFGQAMQQGLITVQERGTSSVENVHWLSLYNNSDKNIYVSSGEIVAGGGRTGMVTHDTIVPAKSGRVDLAVMCRGRRAVERKKTKNCLPADGQYPPAQNA